MFLLESLLTGQNVVLLTEKELYNLFNKISMFCPASTYWSTEAVKPSRIKKGSVGGVREKRRKLRKNGQCARQ